MIKLQTPVTEDKNIVSISYSDKILMLGSCFSDEIGTRLRNFGFDVMINPFGTLYNPISILQSVRLLAGNGLFSEDDCMEMGAGSGLICSFSHHTSAARKTEAAFIEDANASLIQARRHFKECSRVIITLGTSWCFRHKERNLIVSNCLKRPADEFVRERLDLKQTREALEEIATICSGKDIIFTVSPIRHFKDGAHGNQISKSTLLLGIEETIATLNVSGQKCDYFPSYEIVMDELRDYRFYAEDMCHPSRQTADYLCIRFLDWALTEKERPQLEENIRSYRRSCHRPLNAE